MNIDLLPEEDILITHRSGEPGFYMRPEQQKANPHFHYQYELLLCAGGLPTVGRTGGQDQLYLSDRRWGHQRLCWAGVTDSGVHRQPLVAWVGGEAYHALKFTQYVNHVLTNALKHSCHG